MTETVLQVSGMTCDGCERSIVNALRRLDGVEQARADHKTGRVSVGHAEGVRVAALEAAVEDAGYDVVPEGRRDLPMA